MIGGWWLVAGGWWGVVLGVTGDFVIGDGCLVTGVGDPDW